MFTLEECCINTSFCHTRDIYESEKRSINKAFPSHALYYVKRQYRVVYGLVEALIAFLPLAY